MNSIATAFHRINPEMAERAGFRHASLDELPRDSQTKLCSGLDHLSPVGDRAALRPGVLAVLLLIVCALIGISVGVLSPGVGRVEARTKPGPVLANATAAPAEMVPSSVETTPSSHEEALGSLVSSLHRAVNLSMESRIAALEAQLKAASTEVPVPSSPLESKSSDIKPRPLEVVSLAPEFIDVDSSQAYDPVSASVPEALPYDPSAGIAVDPSAPEVIYEATPVPDVDGRLISIESAASVSDREEESDFSEDSDDPVEDSSSPTRGLQVEGIFWSKVRPMALISGQIVEVGSRVGPARVKAIEASSVTLEMDGQEYTVMP